MSYRVSCSACGKIMTLEDDAAGETLVCVACGTRLEAPPPPTTISAGGWEQMEQADVPGAAVAEPARSTVTARRPAPAPGRTPRDPGAVSRKVLLSVIGGGLAVIVIAVLLTAWIATGVRSRWANQANSQNLRDNSDLLALKSEAEALAIQGKLPEAHEKYRRLQQLWATRDIRDGLMWDIMERAKVDQDKIYMILLNRMAPAIPDPRPGTVMSDGTVIPGGPAPDAQAGEPQPNGGYPATYGQQTEAPPAGQPGTNSDTPPQPDQKEAPQSQAQTAGQPQAAAQGPAQATAKPVTRPAAATATAPANGPPPNLVTDAEIGEALKRGIDYLIPEFDAGLLDPQPGLSPSRQAGLDALCVYALLASGQAMKDPRLDIRGDFMKQCLEKLKTLDMQTRPNGPQQHITYARSLRAAALAVYNRPEDRKVLKEDVDWLVAAAVDGAYTYDDRFTKGPSPRASADLKPEISNLRFEISDGAPVRFADGWGADDGAAVIPIHGRHDPRTGAEIDMLPPPPPSGYGTRNLPRDSRTPLPGGYPQRTRRPGVTAPGGSKIPWGMYGWGGGMPDPGPDPLPERPGAPGSSSSVRFPWDHSNSQYGLLGVWSGAEVGIEVPVRYWKDVERHWTLSQMASGEWGYKANDPSGTFAMTSGGLASLFVTHDWLAAPMVKDNTGRPPLTRAIVKGLAWMEDADHCVATPNPLTHYFGYDLYGLERVGLACGFKYFGTHDWYRELAAKAVGAQGANGAWGRNENGSDTLIDTAYTLLFLSRGRHPILMNKLQWDRSEVTLVDGKPAPGYWANRPRDIANLTRYASRQLERVLNWQVVSLDVESSDWLDSPVLYIASHQAPGLEDADYEKLRQFVEAGGVLFTHADTGAGAFNRWVPKLVEKVCPGRKLEDLPADHFVYNLVYKIKASRPALQSVSNGSRLLIVHSPGDLASAWQQRGEKLYPDAFRLGVNLFVYAAGKADLRNRLNSPFIPEPTLDPEATIQVARIKYTGNWDPEPGAWPRFRRLFEWQTRISVEHPPVELKDLRFDPDGKAGQRFAHLTGTSTCEFSGAEVAAAKAFVEAGGILLVDPCGGSPAFADAARDTLLDKAFPGIKPQPVPADHPLLRGAPAGKETGWAPRPRPYVAETMPGGAPELRLIRAGKGAVIVSRLDVTSGLLGTNTWGIAGYEPDSAAQLVRNALSWARDGATQ